jgi:hypothetical protein
MEGIIHVDGNEDDEDEEWEDGECDKICFLLNYF